MSEKAWKMDEAIKIKIGKYIIDTIKNKEKFPDTPEKGKEKLLELGVAFEGDVTGVVFHENDANGIMHIAIPPREAIKDNYENPEDYKIPETYVNITQSYYEKKSSSGLSPDETYQFRIGDYTISHCG